MYYIDHIECLDERQSLHIIDTLAQLSQGKYDSKWPFPPLEKLPYFCFNFSDNIPRIYDEVNGFIEI